MVSLPCNRELDIQKKSSIDAYGLLSVPFTRGEELHLKGVKGQRPRATDEASPLHSLSIIANGESQSSRKGQPKREERGRARGKGGGGGEEKKKGGKGGGGGGGGVYPFSPCNAEPLLVKLTHSFCGRG